MTRRIWKLSTARWTNDQRVDPSPERLMLSTEVQEKVGRAMEGLTAHGARRVRAPALRGAVDRGNQPRARPEGERGETQHLPRGAQDAARARALCRELDPCT